MRCPGPTMTLRLTASCVLAACLSLGTALGGAPFDVDRGDGEVGELQVVDEELSGKLGAEVAYTVRYTRWKATGSNGKVIVYNHGLQSHRGWFNATAQALAGEGYTFYAFDRIGSGETSNGESWIDGELKGARGHVRHWELFVEVLDRVILLAGKENPGAEIAIWGNSYGAKVVTSYLFQRADRLEERGVTAAVFTTPGLFANSKTMPLPFSKSKLLFSSALARFPVPMVEQDGDNGAAWFVAPGPWFDKIREDSLSLRDATRAFWMQTRSMDGYIGGRKKAVQLAVPAFYLMVRDDRLMDNDKMERHISRHAAQGFYKYYEGGPHRKHFLPFTEDAQQALGDVRLFLEGRATEIGDASPAADLQR
jgi:acylglycerol lipase